MIKEEQKFEASDVLEGMTSISALLNTEAKNDRRILQIWIDEANRRSKAAQIGFLVARSHTEGFSISFVGAEEIAARAIGNTHGGFLAFCTPRNLPTLSVQEIQPGGFYVFLEGIEDPYNFGYALRSLYAAGVTGVVLPPRNWMSAAGVVARASAGASELLPLYVADNELLVSSFREAGYRILCAGIRDSVSVFDEQFPFPLLLVVGGEKRGISRALLEKADRIVRIDYGRQFPGSLSAASAATVLSFELMRQNRNAPQ